MPSGLSKALVVNYLNGESSEGPATNGLTLGRALALGDQPLGNDEGLTRWHEEGMPFVSVAESSEMVPRHLADFHITRLSNVDAAAAFLAALADLLARPTATTSDARRDAPPWSAVRQLVREVNASDGPAE